MKNQTIHYNTIGVKKDATQDEIRKAYLAHAKELHPDKTGGDKEAENKLKEINAAYDILKDKKKRSEYDASLNQESLYNHVFRHSKFADMAYEMFIRRADRFAPQNKKAVIYITLEEAYTGIEKEIRYEFLEKCKSCDGKGGKDFEKCSHCGGSGMIHMTTGFQQVSRTCPNCKGNGGKILDKCVTCSGTGVIRSEKTRMLSIPKGINSQIGQTMIPLAGEGLFGGDLLVFVEILTHSIFERRGLDIASEVEVPLTKALLGGKLKTKSLKGEVEVTIPEGADTGYKLRLQGLGMPAVEQDIFGDHYLFLKVILPKNLSDDAKELVKKLDKMT